MDRLKNYKILYVEDDPKVQKNMQEYLSAIFKEVLVASNGKEGLDIYKEKAPDVALLDIDLPILDGLSLAKEIRSSNIDIPIVMLTAFTDKEKLLKAVELRLLKYLVKPIDIVEFKETLSLIANELDRSAKNIITLSDSCKWYKDKNELYINSYKQELSDKEQKLLKLLIENRKNSVSFETIMANVWEDSFEKDISFGSVKNLVSTLRKKLPKDCICSIYGVGYQIN